MNKMLLGSVALAALLASPAMAADYPVRRAAAFAEPANSWSGFYVGGNVGGVWGHTNPGFIAGCLPAAGAVAFGGGVIPNLPSGQCTLALGNLGTGAIATSVTATGTQPFKNSGWEGGGQIGFNHQYQWAVFGIEAD